ncbi:MAG: flagellar hook assembly protein FlgD [Synergistales bacterium]|nr:flagellar hook assembly protein FlgD [Synergistales bacterium]
MMSNGTGGEQQSTTGNSSLGKDDFLEILITQLTNQDPMDPMKDKEFISQMAQFSELEQITNMSESLDNLTRVSLSSSVGYLGRTVEYIDGEGERVSGEVTGIRFDQGQVILDVGEENSTVLDNIVSVS